MTVATKQDHRNLKKKKSEEMKLGALNSFTPKFLLVILLTVCHTIFMMKVLGIWYLINQVFHS